MKRQLIAALLALNVAAVAVPSATFTVSAAEDTGIETQAYADVEAKKTSISTQITDYKKSNTYGDVQKSKVESIRNDHLSKVETTTGRDDAETCDKLDELFIAAKNAIDDVPESGDITTAKSNIDSAKGALTLSDYTKQKQDKIDEYVTDAKAALDKATTKSLLTEIKDGFVNDSKALEKKETFVKNLKADVNKWLPEGVKSATEYGYYVDADGVSHDSYAAYEDALDDCIDAINTEALNSTASETVMNQAFKDYQDALKALLTKEQGNAKANLDKAIKKAKDDLTAYFPKDKTAESYTGNQLKSIETLKTDGKKVIEVAKSQAEIDKALADAKAKIDAVKTRADVEKSVEAVIAEIKALGEINITNYNNKYNALVAAEDSYEAVEGGAAGQDKIDAATVTAATVTAGPSTMLADARTAYNTHKTTELMAEKTKVDAAITGLTRKNYLNSNIGDQIATLETAAKTITPANNSVVVAIGAGNDMYPTQDTIRGRYNKKLDDIATSIGTDVTTVFGKLNALHSAFVVDDKNRSTVKEAIELYKELVALDPDNTAITSDIRKAYNKLTDLMKAEQDKEADKDLANATISAIPDQVYTGKAIEISNVEVKDKAGNVIDAANYDVSYVNHTNKGTATIKVTAKGDTYKGSKTATFNIVARDIKDAKVTVENLYYRSGKARNASPVVKVDGVDIARNRDYTVTYKNNINVGLATVEITGVNNYTGETKATYAIMPEKAKITSLKAGSKKFTVKVVKEKGAKYQVAYKVKGTSKYKTVTTSNVTKTVKGLKKGKTYSVKVRAYQTINGKKYLGNYSNVKNVKVK